MEYHAVLEKQIRKFLPEQYIQDEQIKQFLSIISNSYRSFEKDKKISEHAFTISEMEYREVTKNLHEQHEITRQSIAHLKDAIRSLAPDAVNEIDADADTDEHNLISIIAFLQKQILKAKELEIALIQSKELAEKAANAKSDFLSVMSHEIRTPLNAIIGYIHLLQNEDPLPSQVDFLRILQISADNLLSLINDVLDFSKIEEGKIIFTERDIDIRQLVNNIKMANRIRAEEKGNMLKVMFDDDIPPFVKGDDIRLMQVLNNLISNAIKFTSNGRVMIEVTLKQMSASHITLHFAIIDSGVGISKDKQVMIFERFTQENSNITREYGGSGLGLSIIKMLLNLQESEIYVDSEPGKGSNFHFDLKFARSASTKRDEKRLDDVKPDLKGISILLVEDVEFNVILAQKLLTNWNARVTVAENGLVALEKIKKGDEFDIVLMDLQMPVMDGLTSAKEIRKINANIPIIAQTASTSADIQELVYQSGINEYVSKPLNPRYLYPTIQKHVYVPENAEG
jgi:signal transduction histidine kinase/CheY-like chemotaxis protein